MRLFLRVCEVTCLLAACSDLRETATPKECAACHGGDNGNPPPDLSGSTDTSRRGVGAHAAHLGGERLGRVVECVGCHVVPLSTRDPGHLDTRAGEAGTPADVRLAGLARANLAGATYDAKTLRCESTWCHARAGAAFPAPDWTVVDGSQVGCDGCHGAPPPAPHPTDSRCVNCHPGVAEGEELALSNSDLHLDGVVDVTLGEKCSSCHGESSDGAPPPALDGSTATTARGVGAHVAHLNPKGPARAVECVVCHVVPSEDDLLAEGHIDSALPAEVMFSGLARAEDASPRWDGERCGNTYCHGATLTGGNAQRPIWTQVDESQRQCDSCHGNPPPAPHPQWERCDRCHPDADAEGGIADASLHIDGTVDVIDFEDEGCASCHGTNPDAPAPPPALDGSTDTTARGVGAHDVHLSGTARSRAVTCSDCHVVPSEALDAGHFDNALPAEVSFGPMAELGGSTPAWDGERCENVYCHGSILAGGSATSPKWTQVDGSQNQCGSCHGFPPPAPHTAWTRCDRCHSNVNASGDIVDPTTHVDGVVDVMDLDALACNTCHGTDPAAPAPPPALDGSTATTTPGVGAHAAHLEAPIPILCVDCHEVPASVSAPLHIDAEVSAEATFPTSSFARSDGAIPSYDSVSCSGVYCHGATLSGGTTTSPTWTTVDGSQAACGTCHGTPPPLPHPSMTECFWCHPTATGPGEIVDPLLHVNGVIDCQPLIPCD